MFNQSISIDYLNVILPIHKCRNLRHFRQTIFFFNTRNSRVIFFKRNILAILLYELFNSHSILRQEMSSTTGIIYCPWYSFIISYNMFQRQRRNKETNNRHWCEELSLTLFDTSVQETFKQITQELILINLICLQSNVLQHLHHFPQNYSILTEKLLIMYTDK